MHEMPQVIHDKAIEESCASYYGQPHHGTHDAEDFGTRDGRVFDPVDDDVHC